MDLTSSMHAPSDPGATTMQRPAIAGTGRSQCARCGAPLAAEQRYCVECGQRQAEARPPLLRDRAALIAGKQPAAAASVVAAPAGVPRTSNQTLLVAVVGVLILAMGVGVLIGRSGKDASTPVQAVIPQPQVVASTPALAATTPTTPVDDATTTKASDDSATKKAKKAAAAAAASGSEVISSDDKKPLPKKVGLGSKGSGKGYENGEFTGNFFGP